MHRILQLLCRKVPPVFGFHSTRDDGQQMSTLIDKRLLLEGEIHWVKVTWSDLSAYLLDRCVRVGLELGQIWPNGTNLRLFKISFSTPRLVIFGSM